MKKQFILACGLALTTSVFAQETELTETEKRIAALESTNKTLQKFKVSGYIQAQWQHGQSQADGINFKLNRANNFESNPYYSGTTTYKGFDDYSRFGIRRGRIKFTYDDKFAEGVFQLDITERGVGFKDAYIGVRDHWFGTQSTFKAGIFNRPFGYEITYSSSRRESPERSRIFQTLFPDERDLGCMLTLQADKKSSFSILKLDAGLFSGNGINRQIDSRMDFIGRLSTNKAINKDMSLSGGVSLYLGGVRQLSNSIYVVKDNKFVLESDDNSNIGKIAKRQYIGFDVQYSVKTTAGRNQLRGEYIFGEHPGTSIGAYDFRLTSLPTAPVYMRNISGGYVLLVQDFGKSPFSGVVKYDTYNPNTKISDNDITGAGEITINTLGFGAIWRINSALNLTGYYEIVNNETTDKLKNIKNAENQITAYGWEGNRPANVFTLRLQYRF